MRKISKAKQKKFVKEVRENLKRIGAIMPFEQSLPDTWYEYELDTKGGLLKIKLPLESDHVFTYTIYTRFEDVDEAKELGLFGMNQFSGKYNRHLIGSANIDEVIKEMDDHIKDALI